MSISSPPTGPILHDAARFLALADMGRIAYNSRRGLDPHSLAQLACASALQATHPSRLATPRTAAGAPIVSFLWQALGHLGLIASGGGAALLSATALDWLDQPPSVQLDSLRHAWLIAPEICWSWLPSCSRLAANRRCPGALSAAAGWLAAQPIDRWITLDDALAHLSLDDTTLAANFVRQPGQRGRTRECLAFVLYELMPVLALVETDSYSGTLCLRPSPAGARWLERAARTWTRAASRRTWQDPPRRADSQPEIPATPAAPVQIDETLLVTIPLAASAADTFEITHFAELLHPSPPARYQITPASLAGAAALGYPTADLPVLLASLAGGPLPAAAARLLAAWQRDLRLIVCEPGYRLHPKTPSMAAELRRLRPYRRAVAPLVPGRTDFVPLERAGPLFRCLQRSGTILAPSEPVSDGRAALPPAHIDSPLRPTLRRGLPLVPLMVLLGTYRCLSLLLPGLAALPLEEFEGAIAAALSPDDLAAVQRLTASHAALLVQALGRQPVTNSPSEADSQEQLLVEAQGTPGVLSPDPIGDVPPSPGPAPAAPGDALAAQLAAAIAAGRTIDLTYADTKARLTRRRVRPLRLETRWGQDYLVALCELRGDERRFRLDRIIAFAAG